MATPLISRLPLIWRVPLAVAALMIVVSAVITERVLDRLVTIQEKYLQNIADSYLDGIMASISPSILREDSWEIFDALERLRPVNSAIVPVDTIVTLPSGIILAASDPLKFPVLKQIDAEIAGRFTGRKIRIEQTDGHAFLKRAIIHQGKMIGRIHTVFDARVLLQERRDVLSTLILSNAALTALLGLVGFATVRRMISPMQTLESHMIEAAEGRASRIAIRFPTSRNSETARLFAAYNSLLDADEERRELTGRLAEEEKLASLGRLSSVMAHEINNPLGGLLNAVDTLRKHGEKEDVRRAALDLLQRGLQGIGEVVRAALATYRPDRQARPLARHDFDDAALLVTPELRRRGQSLRVLLEADPVFSCPCPAGPVRQAVINLLLNASAASPDGADLVLAATATDRGALIEVADRGAGLPAASQLTLVGRSARSLPDSNGLGLWVVRQIADELGAHVDVSDRPGGGTIVGLMLGTATRRELDHAA